MDWLQWLMLVAVVANTVSFTINWLMFRRWRRLDVLLFGICISAFLNRHMPIWVPWCAAHRVAFRVELEPMPPRRRPREHWAR